MKKSSEQSQETNFKKEEKKRIITFDELRLFRKLVEAEKRGDLEEVERIRKELGIVLRGNN